MNLKDMKFTRHGREFQIIKCTGDCDSEGGLMFIMAVNVYEGCVYEILSGDWCHFQADKGLKFDDPIIMNDNEISTLYNFIQATK